MRKALTKPLPLAQILKDAFTMATSPSQDPLERLQAGWPRWAGETLSAKSRPLKIQDGRLTVGVASSVWANEMEFKKEEIIEAIGRDIPSLAVHELRYRIVTRPSGSI